jgi:hypothetical protein
LARAVNGALTFFGIGVGWCSSKAREVHVEACHHTWSRGRVKMKIKRALQSWMLCEDFFLWPEPLALFGSH